MQFIELEARLEALARLVRRAAPPAAEAPLELLAGERAARLNGATVSLSAREFRLLEHLHSHVGEVVSAEQLGQQVGDALDARSDLVQASIARLRRKLAPLAGAPLIQSVAGHGYVLRPPAPAGRK